MTRHQPKLNAIVAFLALAVIVPPIAILGQAPPNPVAPVATPELISLEQAQSRIAQLQGDQTLSASQKQALIPIYEAIVSELRLRSESEKQVKELAAKAEAAPEATLEAKTLQQNPPAKDLMSVDALRTFPVAELEKMVQAQQSQLQMAVDGRTKTEAAITARETSKKELPRSIAEEKSNLKKLNDELAVLPKTDSEDPLLREAKLLLLRVQIASTAERIRKSEQELRLIEAESELLPIRRAIFAADEKYYNGRVKEIVDELNKRRETKVAQERAKTIAVISETVDTNSPPELLRMSERLAGRADDWYELAKKNTALQLEIEQADSDLAFWTERHRIMTDRSRSHRSQVFGSINSWNGLLLRRHRNELPDESRLREQLNTLVTRLQQTETKILELEDWKNEDQGPRRIDSGISTSESGFAERLTGSLAIQADRLLANEKELVANFTTDANNYSDNLSKLAEIKQQTIDKVVEYRAFIDQQILWLRSAQPIGRQDILEVWPALQYVFDYRKWIDAGWKLLLDVREKPYQAVFLIGVWFLLLVNTTKMRRATIRLGEIAVKTTTMDFWITGRTIVCALLLSAPIPLMLAAVGYRFQHVQNQTQFTASLALACLVAARYFYPLEFLRQVSRRGGLAEMHFGWLPSVTTTLRRNLRWLIDLGVPMAGLCGFLFNLGDDDQFEYSLGRICFVVLMFLCSAFFAIVLHPRRGALSSYLEQNRGSWIERLRYLWYSFFVLGPVLLAVNSLSGYHYTAVRLSMLCHTTLITMLSLFLVYQTIKRWSLLSRRRIMTDQARQRLESAQRLELESLPATSASTRAIVSDLSSPDMSKPFQSVDLNEINAQTLRFAFSILVVIGLVSTGYVWSGVLPAVSALNSVTLWTVAGTEPGVRTPFTLADLLISIPIIIFTYLAAKNLPGLLEIALLQRLPFDNAARYAIASLSRYAILFVGIIIMFQTVGVRWDSIQWLVAALGVGLGFGLQEIFANFVSGLILLFEQPIRIGDVITIGDVTGSVSRIRMRSTTITNWDRKELVIPNKDLVTGRLLNWTLSDTTNRLVIEVGIPYGSDSEGACRIIQKICDEHDNVLTDPPGTVHLDNFGPDSLRIVARIFLAKLEERIDTRHQLLTSIHEKLNEAGIEFALPKRDLNIRSIPEAWQSSAINLQT